MSFRIEEKLSIDRYNIVNFKKQLEDKNIKQIYKRRKIHSVYFENNNNEMFTDSIEALTPRKKIRVRNYPETDDNEYYLEIKISSVEGRFKKRTIIDKSKFDSFKTKGILDPQYGLCKPLLYVSYEREYFKVGDVRISIDNNIKYRAFSNNVYINEENSIVEIKTSIRKNLDELIEDFPYQRKRFSKYCNAVEKVILK